VSADAPGFYHPGRSGVVRQGPKIVLATFGEVHPSVLAALDLPAFQPLRRDFAFIVPDAVAADALLRAARGADKALVTDVALFDVYRGKGVPEGSKSLAIQVTIQPREATLTDVQIEAVADRIVAAVVKATGATLRA
jgi:phenylalanyl-tRNA synthetase beta chain